MTKKELINLTKENNVVIEFQDKHMINRLLLNNNLMVGMSGVSVNMSIYNDNLDTLDEYTHWKIAKAHIVDGVNCSGFDEILNCEERRKSTHIINKHYTDKDLYLLCEKPKTKEKILIIKLNGFYYLLNLDRSSFIGFSTMLNNIIEEHKLDVIKTNFKGD